MCSTCRAKAVWHRALTHSRSCSRSVGSRGRYRPKKAPRYTGTRSALALAQAADPGQPHFARAPFGTIRDGHHKSLRAGAALVAVERSTEIGVDSRRLSPRRAITATIWNFVPNSDGGRQLAAIHDGPHRHQGLAVAAREFKVVRRAAQCLVSTVAAAAAPESSWSSHRRQPGSKSVIICEMRWKRSGHRGSDPWGDSLR